MDIWKYGILNKCGECKARHKIDPLKRRNFEFHRFNMLSNGMGFKLITKCHQYILSHKPTCLVNAPFDSIFSKTYSILSEKYMCSIVPCLFQCKTNLKRFQLISIVIFCWIHHWQCPCVQCTLGDRSIQTQQEQIFLTVSERQFAFWISFNADHWKWVSSFRHISCIRNLECEIYGKMLEI